MPVFKARSRVQILRDMASRVVARSNLTRIERNSGIWHVLSGAATELAEIYFQLARLRDLFSIDRATGSDLDARAAEIQPGVISRRLSLFASGQVVFSRQTIVGTVNIAAGTIIAAESASGLIRYRTTAVSTILAGNLVSSAVDIVALEAGERGNVAGDAVVKFVTRVAGVTGVTNAVAINNGRNRESDREFRARLKAHVQSLSRATVTALEGYASNVQLSDGRRVIYAKVVEPVIPSGVVELFIDDGTGSVEEFSETYLTSADTIIAAAAGGEEDIFTTDRPIRDDGSFALYINGVLQVRNTDYTLNPALGQVSLTAALIAADVVTANYRSYTGLIQQTQKVMDGDPTNPLVYPGVRGAGVLVLVKAPTTVFQTLQAAVAVSSDYDVTATTANVAAAVQEYINTLAIGQHVIAAEIIERAMSVDGVTNFRIQNLTGSLPPVADQIILKTQVARIASSSITLV